MVVAYVTVHPTLDRADAGTRIYALVLPCASSDEWEDVLVRNSNVSGAGFGVFPSTAGGLNWSDLRHPVLLPYLGMESVVTDHHSLKLLVCVLRGEFLRLTTGELMAASNDEPFVADGIFAVPLRSVPTAKQGRTPLVASVELLQVVNPEAANRCRGGVQDIATGTSSVCYLLAADVRKALGLHGAHSHLFDLLCAHARHEHPDRHLATHCATLHRKEEGYVLINGHPGFLDAVAMTAMINEPAAKASACLKMITGYTRLLADDHPLMVHAGLGQPPGAREAWEATVLPPEGGEAPPGYSERMVLYASTRKAYGLQQELTVDYGKSYMRNYASGLHRPSCKELTPAPPERLSAAQLLRPNFPQLPGWFNPHRQPTQRPAFRIGADGVRVCEDDPSLVRARLGALGLLEAGLSQGSERDEGEPGTPRLYRRSARNESEGKEEVGTPRAMRRAPASRADTPTTIASDGVADAEGPATLEAALFEAVATTSKLRSGKTVFAVPPTRPTKTAELQLPSTTGSGAKRVRESCLGEEVVARELGAFFVSRRLRSRS
jgi:hypothetical protein